jgi:glycosyltransferase 2 family protein
MSGNCRPVLPGVTMARRFRRDSLVRIRVPSSLLQLAKRQSILRFLKIAAGLIVGAMFVVLLVRQVDISQVRALLREASAAPLLLAIVAFIADFAVRAVRFWSMLSAAAGRRLPLSLCIGPYIASFGVNDVVPLRAGDGLRVIWFSRRFSIPAGTVIGTMMTERLLDLLTVLLFGGLALTIAGAPLPPLLVSGFQLILAAALVGGAVLMLAPAALLRLLDSLAAHTAAAPVQAVVGVLRAISAAILRTGSPGLLIWFSLLSLVCWALEALVFYGAWLSLGGAAASLTEPFLAFSIGTLGALAPGLPGHFGSYEYFGVETLKLLGTDPSFAASFIFLAHLVLWIPTALFGVVWLLIGPSLTASPARSS